MAILYEGVRCALCDAKLDRTKPLFATSGCFFAPGEPLLAHCDAPMHWDCYAAWPERERFAAGCLRSWIEQEKRNPYWAKVLLDDEVFITVNPDEPVTELSLMLAATGSRMSIKLCEWAAWLASPAADLPCDHDIERNALVRVHARLRSALPTADAVLAAVDRAGKQELRARLARQQQERARAAGEELRAYNEESARLDSATLRCPHCASRDTKFRDGGAERKSYWQCNACNRSFRKEDLNPRS